MKKRLLSFFHRRKKISGMSLSRLFYKHMHIHWLNIWQNHLKRQWSIWKVQTERRKIRKNMNKKKNAFKRIKMIESILFFTYNNNKRITKKNYRMEKIKTCDFNNILLVVNFQNILNRYTIWKNRNIFTVIVKMFV